MFAWENQKVTLTRPHASAPSSNVLAHSGIRVSTTGSGFAHRVGGLSKSFHGLRGSTLDISRGRERSEGIWLQTTNLLSPNLADIFQEVAISNSQGRNTDVKSPENDSEPVPKGQTRQETRAFPSSISQFTSTGLRLLGMALLRTSTIRSAA